jgi:hypothetical protein
MEDLINVESSSQLRFGKQKEEKVKIVTTPSSPTYERPFSDSVALCQTQQPHHPVETTSERRSPQRKPRLGLAGFEPATSDRLKEKPIPDEGDASSMSV